MKDRGGTVLLPLDESDEAYERVLREALSFADLKTKMTGRKFVVREDAHDESMLFVVPFYIEEHEGTQREAVFSELGQIVEESLNEPPNSKPKPAIVG
ncbi:MAG: hypothetical protein WC565_02125 [Parcubacteria group bacterium]